MSFDPTKDTDWLDISTAPRDGTVIEVMDPDAGAFPMKWNDRGFNMMASRTIGLWESPSGGFTWTEDGGFGPTKWRPYKAGRYAN